MDKKSLALINTKREWPVWAMAHAALLSGLSPKHFGKLDRTVICLAYDDDDDVYSTNDKYRR
jgi:hypothetical protein